MRTGDPLFRPLPDSYELPPLPDPPPVVKGRSWGATVGGLILLAVTFWGLLSLGPFFEEAYAQMQRPKPAATEVVLRLSQGLRSWIIPAVLLGLLYPWWLGKPASGRGGRLARTLSVLTVVSFGSWAVWALFQPLVAIPGPLSK
jgi:hypothetical protein